MIRQYRAELTGITPLLMHSDNIDWADQMELWRADPANRDKSKAGDDRTPAFRWIGSVYHNDDVICMSSDNLARCLMEGGALVPVPGKGKKTFKAQTQSGMKVDDLLIPLHVSGKIIPMGPINELMNVGAFPDHIVAARKMGFSLFSKRVRIGAAKHIRVRPKFDSWKLIFTISVWDEAITKDVLRSVLDYSGMYKGLSDWRPGSKTPGSYGMFKVEALEQI